MQRPVIALTVKDRNTVADAVALARSITDCAREQAAAHALALESERVSRNEAGWNAGFEHGLAQFREAIATEQKRCEVALEAARPAIVEIILGLTRELLGDIIERAPETLLHCVTAALKQLQLPKSFSIYANPAIAERIGDAVKKMHGSEITVLTDSSIPIDSIQIGCGDSFYDLSPVERLEQIRSLLRTRFGE